MPIVKMPDGTLVNFPDNPTDEQVAQLKEIGESMMAKPQVPMMASHSRPSMAPSHAVGQSIYTPEERAIAAAETAREKRNRELREQRGISELQQTAEGVPLSVGIGALNLAKIPGGIMQAVGGIKERAFSAAEQALGFEPVQAPKPTGEIINAPFSKAQEAIRGIRAESASPVIVDPVSGEEFLNPSAAKDVNFWVSLIGEEAPAMAIQAMIASGTGGASLVNPAVASRLAKAGKVGQVALKFLRKGALQKMVGFEAARTLAPTIEEAKQKYMDAGDSEEMARQKAAVWGSVSSALQGAAGGLELGIMRNAFGKYGKTLTQEGLGFLTTALKEGGEEALQSIIGSAVAKMSYDPKLTLDKALVRAGGEGIGGGMIGLSTQAAGTRSRMRAKAADEPGVEPTVAPAGIEEEATPEPTPIPTLAGTERVPQQTTRETMAANIQERIDANTNRLTEIDRAIEAFQTAYGKTKSRKSKERLDMLRSERERITGILEVDSADLERTMQIPLEPLGTEFASQVEPEPQMGPATPAVEEMMQRSSEAESVRMPNQAQRRELLERGMTEAPRIELEAAQTALESLIEQRDQALQAAEAYTRTKDKRRETRLAQRLDQEIQTKQSEIEAMNRAAGLTDITPEQAAPQPEAVATTQAGFKPVNVASPEFKTWFGDSTAVDETGKPKRFYHGTMNEFGAFAPNGRRGSFFTTEPEFASAYGGDTKDTRVIPVYLKTNYTFDFENPAHVAAYEAWGGKDADKIRAGDFQAIEWGDLQDFIKEKGFDSYYTSEDFNGKTYKNIAVFDPSQVKSAVSNTGAFSQTDPRLMYSGADLTPAMQAIYADLKQRIGLPGTASNREVLMWVREQIKTLGKTTKETAIKIMNKVKGISRKVADALAEELHKVFAGTRESQRGAIGPDINKKPEDQVRDNIKQNIPVPEARHEAYAEIGKPTVKIMREEDAKAASIAAKQVMSDIANGNIKGVPREFMRTFGIKSLDKIKDGMTNAANPAYYYMKPEELAITAPLVFDLNRELYRFTSTRENILQKINDPLKAWESLSPQQAKLVGEALAYGTLDNNMGGKVYTDQELRDKFKGIEPEAIIAYRESRKFLDTLRDELIEAEKFAHQQNKKAREELIKNTANETLKKTLQGQLEESDKAFDAHMKGLSNKAYFPLQRYGKYRFELINGYDNKRVGMTFLDENTEEAITAAIKRMMAQSPQIRKLQEQGMLVQGQIEMNPDLAYLREAGGAIFDGSYLKYLSATKTLDDSLSAEAASQGKPYTSLLNTIELMAADAYLQDSFKAHLEHRTGLPGYSMDGLRAMRTHAMTIANRVATLRHGTDMSKKVEAFGNKATGKNYDPRLEREARDLVDVVRNPPSSAVVSALMEASYLIQLAANPAFALVNSLQQFTVSLPVLGNFYGHAAATKAIAKANLIAHGIVRRTPIFGGVEDMAEADLRDAINKAVPDSAFGEKRKDLAVLVRAILHDAARNGDLKASMSNEVIGTVDDISTVSSKHPLRKALEFFEISAKKPEQQNRIATLVAAIILADQKGIIRFNGQDGWNLEKLDTTNPERIVETREFVEFMNHIINFGGGRPNKAWYQRQKGPGGAALRAISQYKGYFTSSVAIAHQIGKLNASNERDAMRKGAAYLKLHLTSALPSAIVGGISATIPAFFIKALLGMMFSELELEEIFRDAREKAAKMFEAVLEKTGYTGNIKEQAKRLVFYGENGWTNALPFGMGYNLNASMTPNLFMSKPGASMGEMAASLLIPPFLRAPMDALEWAARTGETTEGFFVATTPKGIKRAWDAITKGEAKSGATGIELLTPQEKILYGLSLMPTRVSEYYQNRSVMGTFKRGRTKVKDKMRFQWAKAQGTPQQNMVEFAIKKAITEFNGKYGDIPDMKLSWGEIKNAAKSERKSREKILAEGVFNEKRK